jgi:hypothetical protein
MTEAMVMLREIPIWRQKGGQASTSDNSHEIAAMH